MRDIFLKDCAFHSVRIIQSSYVKLDGIRIYNRVNHNNDGFHFISAQHVYISNCDVAMPGRCLRAVRQLPVHHRDQLFVQHALVGVPVRRRRGGEHHRFQLPHLRHLRVPDQDPRRRRAATGEYFVLQPGDEERHRAHFDLPGSAQSAAGPQPEPPQTEGIVRNISFRGIRATVSVPAQLPDVPFTSGYNPGEIKSCIGLSGVGAYLENISFDDVQVTFPGGGTAEEGALRDVPKVVGEYYAAGVFPAYALYARNVRGLTLNNVPAPNGVPKALPKAVN